MRALAVLLVIAGHLFPSAIPGGFIGVDIFFVISGFVITQHMVELQAQYPQTFLRTFYARRIRRILPSALLVLITAYCAARYFLGVVAANDFTLDGFWAALFLSNFRFQSQSLDYFSAGISPSLIQHFWSLSIEEQFYLIWPALFLITGYLTVIKVNQKFLLIAMTSASLTFALYMSEIHSSAIFFNSLSRIWELALGALCALIAWRKFSHIILEVGSIAALLACALLIEQSMQWPRATTLPVVALTCLLLARRVPTGSLTLLSNPIAGYIGDLSYLLYLWHWPILMIVKSQSQKLGPSEVFIVLLATAALSISTHHLYENPLRHSQLLITWPRATILAGTSTIAIVATVFYALHQG